MPVSGHNVARVIQAAVRAAVLLLAMAFFPTAVQAVTVSGLYSVEVPVAAPWTTTLTNGRNSPVTSLVTTPFTEAACPMAESARKRNERAEISLRASILGMACCTEQRKHPEAPEVSSTDVEVQSLPDDLEGGVLRRPLHIPVLGRHEFCRRLHFGDLYLQGDRPVAHLGPHEVQQFP